MSERSERTDGREPRPLGEALDGLLRSMRGGPTRRELGGVFGTWDEAVGPTVAAHVQPVRLDSGVLVVEVDDPSWATQVRLLHDDLLRRITEACGVSLQRIEVRVARAGRAADRHP